MSAVAPGYAPTGASLITASILEEHLGLDDEQLDQQARAQLGQWFGAEVNDWHTLRVNRIKRALPRQDVGSLNPMERDPRLKKWLWVAGDWRATSSIDGALASGRHAGEQLAVELTSKD
jgi:predicted NAD/FAD-dependent oxidoreductase